MIISADGKEVGGMTTIGLEIALEEAGQEIVLLVSRYKDTRDTHYGFLTLQADDVAENQSSASCHVEWTDICDFDDAQKENHVLMAEDAPHLFPSLAKTEVSNAALAIDSVFPNDDVPNKERIHEPSQDVPAAPEGCYLTESVGFYSQDAPVQDIERDGYDEDAEFDRYGCPNSPGKVRANVLANAKTFAVSMGDLSITQPVVNKNCNTTDEASSLGCDTDDGNAWCGCVCGQLHDPSNKTLTIFWIQCGVCFTWYDCSTKCLGFTERNAESLDWACWACDENRVVLTEHIHFSTSSGSNLAKHLSSSKTSTRLFSTSMSSLKEVAAVSNTSDHELVVSLESSINHSENCVNVSIDNCDEEVFVEGDYVKIDEHAWPGVNNPEGIAKVLKAYTDDDGDQVYDVKYIVGGRKNGVLPEYLSLHLF